MSEIPPDEHFELLAHGRVYAMPLVDNRVSTGHIRLMTAITAGIPVVATRVSGLHGYLPGCATHVNPADPLELRTAVNALLASRRNAVAAAERARHVAAERPWRKYIADLGALVDEATLKNL